MGKPLFLIKVFQIFMDLSFENFVVNISLILPQNLALDRV